jgi:hypothetical protein
VGDGAGIELEPLEDERCRALGLAGHVGDRDALRAERLGDADLPAAADT